MKNLEEKVNNVINFNREEIPTDLIRFKDVYAKYGIKYCTLYKYTRILREIPFYNKGGLKVSETDLKNWLKKGLVEARG